MKATGTKAQKRGTKAVEKQIEEECSQADSTQLLDEFWKQFRLSSVPGEHALLTRPLLLSLVAVGPLILLVLFSVLMAVTNEVDPAGKPIFSDLSDPIFMYVTLALLFGALLYSLDWYPQISKTFQSLFVNKVICSSDGKPVSASEYLIFLQGYRRSLHSRRRYILPSILGLLVVASTVLVRINRPSWGQFEIPGIFYFLHFLARWVLAPAAWGFAGGLALWTVHKTTQTIKDIAPYFQINVQPLHSDRAGGLKKVGDLCSHIGLLIIVTLIPIIFLSARGTTFFIQSYACGNEMGAHLPNPASPMTEERVAECLYYLRGGEQQPDAILEKVRAATATGISLEQQVSYYYEAYQSSFQLETLLQRYDIYFPMNFFILVILVCAVVIVIVPMWDIHQDMRDFKQRREREVNNRISSLYFETTEAIARDDLEQAGKIKTKIKFFTDELTEIQKYPTWPISSLPVIRSFLTSSVLSALFTYIVSALQISIGEEARGVIESLIKP